MKIVYYQLQEFSKFWFGIIIKKCTSYLCIVKGDDQLVSQLANGGNFKFTYLLS